MTQSKPDKYAQILKEARSILEGEESLIARMATLSCLLHTAFADRIWTGFYLADPARPGELVVGPYQGSLGCLRIPPGRGVCGAAVISKQTQVVNNVQDFSGHIACDNRSVSEIVVPVLDTQGQLLAVLDIDSDKPAMFDAADQQGLEALVAAIFPSD